ncbi:DUF1365 domain-containing protein [Variovorax dokdonensis]|uniref:DUF1365 domain-containing protein n=1 Tax=Variovorax dokdonensis TaxID=344883 RepID=A0ABT7N982_9BURK|nr:DUF1365 domain-containing protein [Variovorax dokdonensis]MDM0044497.1 DUF1365 domain-containing protein [Variovorax dokdonensis]
MMNPPASRLLSATVVHQRMRPLRHRLRYRVVFLLLDLDELESLNARLRLFSLDRPGLFSFRQSDHGAPTGVNLRDEIHGQLRAAGIEATGRVRLLTMPRILGHAFNPLSIFLCEHEHGGMAAVIYEVSNTFGERHRYLVEVEPSQQHATTLRHACGKRLHVSPFMDMNLNYRFTLSLPPDEQSPFQVHIDTCDPEGTVVLSAGLSARQAPVSDSSLLGAFVRHPLLGLKVLGAIHWEALRMLIKGAPFRRHPGAAERPLTVVRSQEASLP